MSAICNNLPRGSFTFSESANAGALASRQSILGRSALRRGSVETDLSRPSTSLEEGERVGSTLGSDRPVTHDMGSTLATRGGGGMEGSSDGTMGVRGFTRCRYANKVPCASKRERLQTRPSPAGMAAVWRKGQHMVAITLTVSPQ